MDEDVILPLAEEVRAARALQDQAYEAVKLVAQVPLVEFMLRQLADAEFPRGDSDLPGEDLVAAAPAWGVELPPIPGREAPMSAHVAARWEQVRALLAVVQPIADGYAERAGAFGALVHDQMHLLEDPMFEGAVAAIVALEARRDALLEEANALQPRVTALRPMITALRGYRDVVAAALASGMTEVIAEGALRIREALASIAEGLDVPLDPPPAHPDPRADLPRLDAWLEARLQAFTAELDASQRRIDTIADDFTALTERLQRQTG